MMMTVINVVSVIKNIVVLADDIYKCIKLVKTNQSQCNRLAARIRVIVEAIAELDKLNKIPETDTFARGIEALENSLRTCATFINEFTQQKRWFYQALKSKKNEQQFESLNQQLQNCLADLNLTILAKQITNREQDIADQKADAATLKTGQAEILSLNQKMMQELQDFKGAASQREEIIARQLMSMKWQLQKMQRSTADSKEIIPVDYQIPFFELTLHKLIGKGSIATIFAGRWNEQPVAIKMLSADLSGAEGLEFSREIKIMSHLRNQHIVQFYGACLEEGHACIVMEYLPTGSLFEYLKEHKLTAVQQKKIALDIARGLQYLHRNQMIHRDLHSGSILLTDEYRAKITDFGLTKTYTYSIKSVSKISQAIPWCAPEILWPGVITTKADVYSFGTILWEIFTGKKPFAGINTELMLKKIQAGEREELTPAIIPKEIQTLISTCWSAEAEKRLDMEDLIKQLEAYDPGQFLYRQGQIFEKSKDYKTAQIYYQHAVDLNFVDAFASLAMLYLGSKDGITVNKTKAYQLLLSAALKDYPRAMKNLAVMLDKGDGIQKDQRQASFWYRKAGDANSLKRAQRLEEKLIIVPPS